MIPNSRVPPPAATSGGPIWRDSSARFRVAGRAGVGFEDGCGLFSVGRRDDDQGITRIDVLTGRTAHHDRSAGLPSYGPRPVAVPLALGDVGERCCEALDVLEIRPSWQTSQRRARGMRATGIANGGIMSRNIVICLDGTNNKIRSAANTNVVRLFEMLDLSDADRQVAYYDPGVGTFSSPAAWSPPARVLSRYAGLAFGAGLRQNLGEAYSYLVSVHQPEDRIFIFGFSRGAYTARALNGMLEVFGLFRPSSINLVPYAVSEYATQESGRRDWKVLREYARIHGRDMGRHGRDHVGVHFVGLWDTVKAAGTLTRELRWPYTRQLPHASIVRHAVSIDEKRRAFKPYLVEPTKEHLFVTPQDIIEVWFAGVHSDVGGMFPDGARLSDIPLKWMAREAVTAGLLVRPRPYQAALRVTEAQAFGAVHKMAAAWGLLGSRTRRIPEKAILHASIRRRLESDPAYAARLPRQYTFADADWLSS